MMKMIDRSGLNGVLILLIDTIGKMLKVRLWFKDEPD